jgi:hypothetical protein
VRMLITVAGLLGIAISGACTAQDPSPSARKDALSVYELRDFGGIAPGANGGKGVLLELQGVQLPPSATSMRVFLLGSESSDQALYYIGSVTRSHAGSPYGSSPGSYTLEVQDALAQAQQQRPASGVSTLRIGVQPTTADGRPVAGRARINSVRLVPSE